MDLFNSRRAFTLLELMIVIAILGVLASLISGNFLTSLTKGRDARRKADLENVSQALELYYEDNRSYPTEDQIAWGNKLCQPDPDTFPNCLANGRTYMQELPTDPKSANYYVYDSDGTYYRLFACIENRNDQGSGVNQDGYDINCGPCSQTEDDGSTDECKYVISSSNVAPAP